MTVTFNREVLQLNPHGRNVTARAADGRTGPFRSEFASSIDAADLQSPAREATINMQYPNEPRQYVVASYRYLRLAMVIVVAVLGVSILIESFKAECLQGSISAYFYTPTHSIFVGALVTLGVALVALKGRDAVEDMFFNFAGVLAFVVALVPTAQSDTVCSSERGRLDINTSAMVSNNVPALLVGTALALFVAYGVARRQGKATGIVIPKTTRVGMALSAVVLVVGVVWYFVWHDNFVRYAHGSTAAAMFVAIWFAVLVNAGWPRWALGAIYRFLGVVDLPTQPTAHHLRYRPWYRGISIFMVAAVAVVLVAGDHKVFWLEVLEIIPFALFWSLQTLESWESGIAEPAMSERSA